MCAAPTGVSTELAGDKHFYTSSGRYTIDDAVTHCLELAGGGKFKLARIHTEQDFNALVQYIQSMERYTERHIMSYT